MLKNKKDRPCDCGSGKKYGKCCGNPVIIQQQQLARGRECGECQACCDLMAIEPLGKPFGTKCEHQCSAGCGIYNARPGVCSVFLCAWKMMRGMPVELRPEKCGIMLSYDTNPKDDRDALFAYEVWEGAFKTIPDGIKWVLRDYLARDPNTCIVYIPYGKRQELAFDVAERYAFNKSFSSNFYSKQDRISFLADSTEEAERLMQQVK